MRFKCLHVKGEKRKKFQIHKIIKKKAKRRKFEGQLRIPRESAKQEGEKRLFIFVR